MEPLNLLATQEGGPQEKRKVYTFDNKSRPLNRKRR
jgi:hypothetical protein